MDTSGVARIVIDQDGKAPGEPGVSRKDIAVGKTVMLGNGENTGVRRWLWRLVERPDGSSASIADPCAARTMFTPDSRGAYVVELSVNDSIRASRINRVVIVASDESKEPLADRLAKAKSLIFGFDEAAYDARAAIDEAIACVRREEIRFERMVEQMVNYQPREEW